MPIKIVNTSETKSDLEIGDTDLTVAYGEEVEVDTELAERLIETGQFARSTTKAAKQAEKESEG